MCDNQCSKTPISAPAGLLAQLATGPPFPLGSWLRMPAPPSPSRAGCKIRWPVGLWTRAEDPSQRAPFRRQHDSSHVRQQVLMTHPTEPPHNVIHDRHTSLSHTDSVRANLSQMIQLGKYELFHLGHRSRRRRWLE